MDIGIKAISVALPSYFLPKDEFCKGRKINEGKLSHLMIEGFAVPKKEEKIEDLMEKAIKEIFLKYKFKPEDVGYLLVATESIQSKGDNLALRLIGLLQKKEKERINLCHVQSVTLMSACASSLSAIEIALSLAKESNKDVLVVAGDISKYGKDKGEETQGGGATAILIGRKPKVAKKILASGGFSCFFPDWAQPFSKKPHFHPTLTWLGYILGTSFSQLNFKKENSLKKKLFDFIDRFCYHRPYGSIVKDAFAFLFAIEKRKKIFEKYLIKLFQKIEKIFYGKKTPIVDYLKYNLAFFEKLKKTLKEKLKKIKEKKEFIEVFDKKVFPSLKYANFIGNAYTASLILCFLSLLKEKNLFSKKVLLVSYGSGLNSTSLCFEILKDYQKFSPDIEKENKKMKKITFEKYLEIRKNYKKGR